MSTAIADNAPQRPGPAAGQRRQDSQSEEELWSNRRIARPELDVRAGELLALLGPNGAGKTTLVRMLLGLARPDAGSVSVFGSRSLRQGQMRARLGAMLQVGRVPETLKVREHIDLFSSYYPDPLPLEETFEIAGLTDIKDRPYGELSGRPEAAGAVRHRHLRQSRPAVS